MSEEEKDKWKYEDGDDSPGHVGGQDTDTGAPVPDATAKVRKDATAGGKMKRKKDKNMPRS